MASQPDGGDPLPIDVKIALDLSNLVHALAQSGIRKRHPEYTPEQVMAALAQQLYQVRADQLED